MGKRFISMMIGLLVLSVILSGCGQSASSDKQIVIGVTQIVEHPSLDAAFDGFKQALEDNGYKEGENVKYDVQIAQGDMNNSQTVANNFVGDKVDLIFANSTPSAQSALNATKDIPIIFTSVTDPIGAELVKSFEEPGGNVTGYTDTHPEAIAQTFDFIIEEMGAKKVGVIYNAGEQNSEVQVEKIKEIASSAGIEIVEASVSTSADVKQATDSLVGRVDVIYVPKDNTVVSALESVISVANDKDIPLFVGELDSMKKGAIAASGFSYFDLGYSTGLMAIKVLEGAKPSELPVGVPEELNIVINTLAAKEQGVEIKDSWKDLAEFYDGE
ncbi:ABC transporter substrate-binding protein [Bacillus salitolerans]|uniref:ABC transporter substrate-binding protein n=1 Tax=Bacillus salitolerans TaxID=1437434 RepID=A0ABW4LPY8_9BACI